MVYVQAARKTAGLMALSMVLSFGIVMFLSGDLEAGITGRVIDENTGTIAGSSWIVFLLGIFVGALMLGAYVYIAHLEARRDE